MTQIDSIDNLISEFEKVATDIEQLHALAAGAADLNGKLSMVLEHANQQLTEIETRKNNLDLSLVDLGNLKHSLKSRLTESRIFEANVSKALIRLKNEAADAIDSVAAKKSELGAEIQKFSDDSAQLLADQSGVLDQFIEDFAKTKGQELNDLVASVNSALQNFNTQKTHLLTSIPGCLQQLETDKQAAIRAFQASVDKAIASLPSQFDQLKGQLTQAMQTHVAKEVQQFLSRQNILVSNLNQRIDALENLNRTQQESMHASLRRLEEVLKNRGGGFLGLFR